MRSTEKKYYKINAILLVYRTNSKASQQQLQNSFTICSRLEGWDKI